MELKEKIISVLKEVYDPEIPVNVYDLGLIYEIVIDEKKCVKILMTLTSPTCPISDYMKKIVGDAVLSLDEVKDVKIKLTFEPKWDSSFVRKEVKEEFGLFSDKIKESGKNISKCYICSKSSYEVALIKCLYKEREELICKECFK